MQTCQQTNPKIYDEIAQLQSGLNKVLQEILEQAGSKIQLEGQAEVKQSMERTNQLLEVFKNSYA